MIRVDLRRPQRYGHHTYVCEWRNGRLAYRPATVVRQGDHWAKGADLFGPPCMGSGTMPTLRSPRRASR